MGYMAKWGPKGFLVSKSKIVPLLDLKTSLTLKEDSENDTSGTPPTNTRGRDLQPITFSTTYARAAGTDPRAQFAEWEKLLGMYYPLLIGGKRFGPKYLKLKNVDMSNVQMSPTGEFLVATISLTFEEYSEGKTTKLVSADGASKGTSTGTTNSGQSSTGLTPSQINRLDAMNASASKQDKKILYGGRGAR